MRAATCVLAKAAVLALVSASVTAFAADVPGPSCSGFGYRVVRGRVGDAIDRTIANQLAKEDMDYIVAPFATDNERRGLWRTEFWGKYMHSAAPLFAYSGCARLKANMDSSVKAVLAAQEPSGYIGNYPDDKRCGAGWDVWGMKYTMMGLIHYYDATGSKEALDAALRLCDYLAGELGPDGRRKRPLAKTGACSGMPSLSNLEPVMWLYNRTKEPRVLKFADYIVAQMDDPKVGPELIRSALAGIEVWRRQNPDREKQDCWKGGEDRLKAYEMMSCYQGLLEYWQVTGRKDCLDAAVASANSIAKGEVNLAGGSCTCEHWFHGALKQYQPYVHLQETCVTTTWLRLLEKLLEVTMDPKWADEFEKTFFNAYLAACRPDGGEFAMYTPLSGSRWHGQHHCRMHTNCCNENGPRGFVSFLRTAAFAKGDAFYLNQYVSGIAEASLADGRKVGFDVYTLYPAEEGVQIAARAASKYKLVLRIPAWCRKPVVKLNDKDLEGVKPGYFEIDREWQAGDMIVAWFPMDVVAHVLDGHVAFTRGPVLLARDSRFGGDVAETVSEALSDGSIVGGSLLVRPPEDAIAMAVTAPLRLGLHSSNPDGARQSQVTFCDYASAGSEWRPGNYYRTWFELEQRPWE